MKKRITAIFLTAVLLLSVAVSAFAAGGVELPIIPAGSITSTQTPGVKLSSDASDLTYRGDTVIYTTTVSNIPSNGLSKLEIVYEYTGGVEFNNDIHARGDWWNVSNVTNANNKLSFTVSQSSSSNELSFYFSVTVTGASGSTQSVGIDSVKLYDKDSQLIDNVKATHSNTSFSTKAAVPEFQNIGASLRINNTPALRFGMLVSKDECFNNAFPSGFSYSEDAPIKFGMLVIETSKLSGVLNVGVSNAQKVIFDTAFSSNNSELVFVHTIDSVSDYSKEYTFRPFVMYKENGSNEYVYSYGETKTRSAKTVAQMQLLSETSNKKIELLNNFTK